MRKKKLPKEPERPERYQILDVLHESGSLMDFVIFDSDETEIAKGSIKWDNCSNWKVYENHFCELKDMQEFHRAVEKCYEIASQKMKNWLTDEIIKSWR